MVYLFQCNSLFVCAMKSEVPVILLWEEYLEQAMSQFLKTHHRSNHFYVFIPNLNVSNMRTEAYPKRLDA